MKIKDITLLVCLLNIGGCALTTLPGAVQDSIGQTESSIDITTAKIKNAKSTENNNYIKHSEVGYFGNQAITQMDTDYLPPVFSNQIQIDKQFF